VARLDEVADVRLGRQRSPKNHSGTRMRPYLRAANVTWRGLDLMDVKEMNFSERESAIYELRVGDVLVAEASGSASEVGKPALWRGEVGGCCFQNTLVRVRSRGPLPEYLRYFLLAEARSGRFGDAAPGIGIHHIGAARLSAWRLPVPPLNEQGRIVAAIEEQFSRLDAAEVSLHRAKQRLPIFSSALVDVGLAGHWPQVPLAELVDVLDSKRVPVNARERAERPGIVPYFGATGQVGLIDRPLFDEELVLLGEDGAPFLDSTKQKAYVINGPSWVNNHAHVLRARPGLAVSGFLKHALDRVDYRPLVNGTTRLKLTQAGMRAIALPAPPIDVQNRIVAEIEGAVSLADSLAASTERAESRSAALRRSILERAFRGVLVPQDLQDEPASVLLESVAADQVVPAPRRRAKVAG
jgi:type I restriction enzyme, S subunit